MRYNRLSPTVRDMRRATMLDLMKHAGFGYDYAQNGGSSEMTPPSTARMPVDIWVEDDVYNFRANLPGFAPEDVAITFEDGELTIRAEHVLEEATDIDAEDGETEESGPTYIRRELFAGSYERKLSFNSPVDAENIAANFENGVLTVSVPKAEEAKPKQIAVNAKATKNSKKK